MRRFFNSDLHINDIKKLLDEYYDHVCIINWQIPETPNSIVTENKDVIGLLMTNGVTEISETQFKSIGEFRKAVISPSSSIITDLIFFNN